MNKNMLLVGFVMLTLVSAGAQTSDPNQKSHPDSASWANLFKDDLSNAVAPAG